MLHFVEMAFVESRGRTDDVKGTRIASISGLRGWVGDGIDPVTAVEFAAAYAGTGLVGIGRGVIAEEAPEWLGLSLVRAVPGHPARGIIAALTGALAGWAAGVGAARAYLLPPADELPGAYVHHVSRTWWAGQRLPAL